jgi:hypothetical protein
LMSVPSCAFAVKSGAGFPTASSPAAAGAGVGAAADAGVGAEAALTGADAAEVEDAGGAWLASRPHAGAAREKRERRRSVPRVRLRFIERPS